MAVYASTTTLEAVNEILLNAGLLPVNSLSSATPDVEKAKAILTSSSRQVQSQGWSFNTDRNFKISPDATADHIIIPLNAMSVDTVGESAALEVTQRDGILRKTNRIDGEDPRVFDSAVYLDIVYYLPFEEIPQAARWYITVKAARRFVDSYSASGTVHGFTREEEMYAHADLMEDEGSVGDYNMLDTMSYVNRRSI